MSARRILQVFFAAFTVCSTPRALPQFYAPDTEFHDAVQRLFVVEAARVLAWRANAGGERIAEVTYQVKTRSETATGAATTATAGGPPTTNRVTIWELKWLDADGNPTRAVTVRYPESLLKQGPAFYRESFRQLWSAGWKRVEACDAAKLEERFWRGAEAAAPSREESLVVASKLLRSARERGDESWVPELAGLLVHTALPGVAGNLTLDRLLLARGAAWLALAEQGCANPPSRLWSPVLFLAERERAATTAWTNSAAASAFTNAVVRGWELWLRRPTTREVYFFAAETDASPMALAMIAYDVLAYQTGELLEQTLPLLAGSDTRLSAWHNYGPLLALWSSIDGGHILDGALPVHQRRAWRDALKQCDSLPQEPPDLTDALRSADRDQPNVEPLRRGSQDRSLTGFTNYVPLLRLGHKEGVGKLVPVAVATGRDLLHYGWEATGQQMGARYGFVQWRWCIPKQAKPILDIVTAQVPGLTPFFLRERDAGVANYPEMLDRLQMADGLQLRVGWSTPPFAGRAGGREDCETFIRRCWLRSSEFEWQARALWEVKNFTRIRDLVEELRDESGPLAAARALRYITSVTEYPKPFQRVVKTAPSLARKLSQPSRLWVRAVWSEKFAPLPPLEKAMELEKTYWQNTDCDVEDWVLHYYCQAGAFPAARRFYLQARHNFTDSVRVSNGPGRTAFVLGYCLDDRDLRECALEDSRSYSSADLVMHIWEAAIQDNRERLGRLADEHIQRYESQSGENSRCRVLKRFLPLLPALGDPNHPRRAEALRHFGKDNRWIVLCWIWIEKFKLPQNDAIVFLCGETNRADLRPLICALKNDARGARECLGEMIEQNALRTPLSVLASFVCRKTAGEPVNVRVPDLKPPGTKSTRDAVLERLRARNR